MKIESVRLDEVFAAKLHFWGAFTFWN